MGTWSVIDNPHALDIVLQPWLVGEVLVSKALASARSMVSSPGVITSYKTRSCLEILRGGRYYQIPEACQAEGIHLDVVLQLRAKRALFDGEWVVNLWEEPSEEEYKAMFSTDVIAIGDTVATGTTLAGVIRALRSKAQSLNCEMPDVVVLTFVGALSPTIEQLLEEGILNHIVYCNARFDLQANGTDLGLVGANWTESAQARMLEELGDKAGSLKCAVWDWGERFSSPDIHLNEVREYFRTLDREAVPVQVLQGLNIE